MKKTINELDVVLLYVSKVVGSMGINAYVFKNNIGLPQQSIMGAPSNHDYFEKVTAEEYDKFRDYVARQLKGIIKALSNDWKAVGDKEIKLVFNKTETSISLSACPRMHDGEPEILSTTKVTPFEPSEITFFDDVTLYLKDNWN